MKPVVLKPDDQPESFAFSKASMKVVEDIISRYPAGRQQSAVMPLLDLVMRQVAEEGAKAEPPHGGWISDAAMDEIARILDMPKVKVREVATFYSMFILRPIGKNHIQCCTTTPCWLRGSAAIVKACEEKLGIKVGEDTNDGLFTLSEVECLGACVNAPMVQINDDYFEDLTPDRMKELIDLLANGMEVPVGSQSGRQCSMNAEGATTLKEKKA